MSEEVAKKSKVEVSNGGNSTSQGWTLVNN